MARRLLYLTGLIALCAAYAEASWPTELTDGGYIRFYTNGGSQVYVKDAWARHAYTACVERATAIDITPPSLPTFFRSERANLVALKTWVSTACVNFVDTRYATNGVFDGYFEANPSETAPPVWTKNGLEAAIGAPTDYFDSTPWRALSSTNTGNGWHYLDDAINRLVWIYSGSGLAWSWPDGGTNTWDSQDLYENFGSYSRTWSQAVYYATNNWASPGIVAVGFYSSNAVPRYGWDAIVESRDVDRRANAYAYWNRLRQINSVTTTPCLVDAYMVWEALDHVGYGCGETGKVFRAYGLDRPTYLHRAASNEYVSGSETNYSGIIGAVTNVWPTPIMDEPDSDDCNSGFPYSDSYARAEGHVAGDDKFLLYRFDATNGFSYVAP